MKQVKEENLVYSIPTMCPHCHLIVTMFHKQDADPVKGAWKCPCCNHKWLFAHRKIRREQVSMTQT